MKLKRITISGFRQLQNIELNFEDNITVIAGGNNSGKTSLTEILGYVFNSSHEKFSQSDIPVNSCEEWSVKAFEAVSHIFTEMANKKERLAEMSSLIFPTEGTENAVVVPPVEVKIQVDYAAETDDIRNFADYLMDLDSDKSSFYFVFRYDIRHDVFQKKMEESYEKLKLRFDSYEKNEDDRDHIISSIKDLLLRIYFSSMGEFAFFTDSEFNIEIPMDVSKFRQLFNYCSIAAGRTLDDRHDDSARTLSKNMLDIASSNDEWTKCLEVLPDELRRPIEAQNVKAVVRKTSVDSLASTIKEISETNGNHTGNLVIDFSVEEHALRSFLQEALSAKYEKDGIYLDESSQGLGYSNLVYLHLQLQKFKLKIDPLLVNFFVIEEPESHMHPQMQNVFAKYLFRFYKENEYQGFITTHSHEIVSNAYITQLRALRQITAFESKLFDLRDFYEKELVSKEELLMFYERMFVINFSDILFADKVIMFEGDTERMLIQYALNNPKFAMLKNQYLSYVQVGGAYAINYIPLVSFLEIKTAIITDLDYSATARTASGIKNSKTTNATIRYAANLHSKSPDVSIRKLYEWKKKCSPMLLDKTIGLSFQGEEDGYARTLEEAMLSKLYSVDAFVDEDKAVWKSRRDQDNLKFSIPRSKIKINARDIVASTSFLKTDFMYSVIMNDLVERMLPLYISEALEWLI